MLVLDWPPRTIILGLRYMPSQVSSIYLLYHNVNKFVLIVPNLVPSQVLSSVTWRCDMGNPPLPLIILIEAFLV
jgi:hypothetical protein